MIAAISAKFDHQPLTSRSSVQGQLYEGAPTPFPLKKKKKKFFFFWPFQENTGYKRVGLTQLKCSGMLVAKFAILHTLPIIGLETKADLYKRPDWLRCNKSVNKILSCQLGATSLLVTRIDFFLSLRNKTWVNPRFLAFIAATTIASWMALKVEEDAQLETPWNRTVPCRLMDS